MANITIPFAGGEFTFGVAERQLGEVVGPNRLPAAPDPSEALERALDRPIGSPRLPDLLRPGMKVAVIIDDISRPTPTALMLPPVLKILAEAGLARSQVRIVIALGTHRPLSPEEIITKTGAAVAGEYEVINTPCWETAQMKWAGSAKDGPTLELNRRVAEADFRIGLGAIGPHLDAGFGGGAKIILPGVCSCSAVNRFHAQSAETAGNQLGNPDSPTRLRLEKLVAETSPLDFILNAVVHPDGGLYRCVAGDFIKAHRRGIQFARELYGAKVRRRYPLVIANAYPFEIDFWQSGKAFWCGELLAEDNGLVVMVSPCPEGAETHPLWEHYLACDPEEIRRLLESGEAEDPNACAFAVMFNNLRSRVRFGMVSPGIPADRIKKMGLLYFDSVEQALERSLSPEQQNAVAVVTHGGIIYPQVTDCFQYA